MPVLEPVLFEFVRPRAGHPALVEHRPDFPDFKWLPLEVPRATRDALYCVNPPSADLPRTPPWWAFEWGAVSGARQRRVLALAVLMLMKVDPPHIRAGLRIVAEGLSHLGGPWARLHSYDVFSWIELGKYDGLDATRASDGNGRWRERHLMPGGLEEQCESLRSILS